MTTTRSQSLRSNGKTSRVDDGGRGTPGSARNAIPIPKQEEYQPAWRVLASADREGFDKAPAQWAAAGAMKAQLSS
jgi:hypothetical protein